MTVRKPKLDPAVRAAVDLLSLEQLRECHLRTYDGPISFDSAETNRGEITAEIHWRIHREERRFWCLAVMTFVAAVAGSVAAVFAVLGYFWPR